jgi:hypothetical protein
MVVHKEVARAVTPAPLPAAALGALLLAARLDLRNWPQAETLARAPLTG